MKNPIQKRLHAEIFSRLAETFLIKKNFSWWALYYASMVFIATGWLPEGIAELLKKEWIDGSYKVAVSLAIIFFIGFKLKNVIKYKGRIEVKSEEPCPVKVLAVFLSPLRRRLTSDDIQKLINDGMFSKKDIVDTEWEMPFKAIEYHSQKLQKIYVFTSRQTHNTMDIFKSAINKIFPSIDVEELKPEGMEFQDIKEVFEAVEELYNKAKEKGFEENDVILDVTSGQVINSIAGAIATLSMGRKFQYVSTRDKNVLVYDVGYFEEEELNDNH